MGYAFVNIITFDKILRVFFANCDFEKLLRDKLLRISSNFAKFIGQIFSL